MTRLLAFGLGVWLGWRLLHYRVKDLPAALRYVGGL